MSDPGEFFVPQESSGQLELDGGNTFDCLPSADASETSVSEASAFQKERANKAVYIGIGIAVWILIKLLRASS